jgi:hypothetical protein
MCTCQLFSLHCTKTRPVQLSYTQSWVFLLNILL